MNTSIKISFFICFLYQLSISQTASYNIRINNINATVLNGGDLFNASFRGDETFEVPKGSNKKTIYTAGLWVGGKDSKGILHLSASTYRQGALSFSPGPVSDNYNGKTLRYDKIFHVTQTEIDYHKLHFTDANYVPSLSISSWPGNGIVSQNEALRLAPFYDLNGNNIYEPLLGEYPLIPGDECAFSIFNDNTDTLYHNALKIEIHQFVYGYSDPTSVLNNTLFVTYKIYNRSANNYEDFILGQFIDYDIGNYIDDNICRDSLRNLMYAFNSDDNDEGISGYGLNPPAMGYVFLNQKMYRSHTYNNDFGSFGNPSTVQHYYNYLSGFNKINQPIPSLNCYASAGGSDVRILGATYPKFFRANTSLCYTQAHIYAKAMSGGAQGSVDLLLQSVDFVQKYFNNNWIDDGCDAYKITNGIHSTSTQYSAITLFPNPAKNEIKLSTELPELANAKYELVNTLGQLIVSEKLSNLETTIDISILDAGIYFIKIGGEVKKFIKE